MQIESVHPHYENIVVNTDGKSYFISSEVLVKILSEFDFKTEKKKTRTWLDIDIEDWRIERFDEPRNY